MSHDPSQFRDPRGLDDEALILACDDPRDGVPVDVLIDEGTAALDAYGETGRVAILALAIHILDRALERDDDGDEQHAHLAATLGDAYRLGATDFDSLDMLARAANAYRTAARHPRLDGMARAAYLSNLGATLLTRFYLGLELDDLTAAVDASAEAVQASAPDDADRSTYWENWSLTQRMLGEVTTDKQIVAEAITAGETACALAVEQPDRIHGILILEGAYMTRYEIWGDPDDLDRVVTLAKEASDRDAEEPWLVALASSHAATAHRLRYELGGEEADLEAAIRLARSATTALDEEAVDPDSLIELSVALTRRFERTGDRADIDEAVAVARRAAAGDPGSLNGRSTLAKILVTRADNSGDESDLDEAVSVMRELAESDEASASVLADLGVVTLTRFELMQNREDLDAAVDALERAVGLMPPAHVDRPAALANLANAYCTRFELIGYLADLNEAIVLGEQARGLLPQLSVDIVPVLANLALAYRERFEFLGKRADLDEAVCTIESAWSTVSPNQGDEAVHVLSELGACRRTLFAETGDRSALDAAIAAGREAVARTLPTDSARASRLTNLAVCFLTLFETTADPIDLDEAISIGRQAAGRPNCGPATETNLSNALLTRFELRSSPNDLDDALEASRRAVHGTPQDSPFLAARLSNLANVLRATALTGTDSAIDEAVDVAQRSVAVANPDEPNLSALWSNLGLALKSRNEIQATDADLRDAVAALRKAVDLTPSTSLDAMLYRSNLGMALRERGEATGAVVDLDEAVTLLKSVIDDGGAERADSGPLLLGLGNALASRHDLLGDAEDLAEAISAWTQASMVRGSSPALRLQAAETLAEAARANGDAANVLRGYEIAVDLLSMVVWRGLDRNTQEEFLTNLRTIASSSGAAALDVNATVRALELLDAGRSILWRQNLHLRDDMTQLARVDKELSDRMSDVATSMMRESRTAISP